MSWYTGTIVDSQMSPFCCCCRRTMAAKVEPAVDLLQSLNQQALKQS